MASLICELGIIFRIFRIKNDFPNDFVTLLIQFAGLRSGVVQQTTGEQTWLELQDLQNKRVSVFVLSW